MSTNMHQWRRTYKTTQHSSDNYKNLDCPHFFFVDTEPEQDIDGQVENETDPDCKILEGLFANQADDSQPNDDISPRASPTNSGKLE